MKSPETAKGVIQTCAATPGPVPLVRGLGAGKSGTRATCGPGSPSRQHGPSITSQQKSSAMQHSTPTWMGTTRRGPHG